MEQSNHLKIVEKQILLELDDIRYFLKSKELTPEKTRVLIKYHVNLTRQLGVIQKTKQSIA